MTVLRSLCAYTHDMEPVRAKEECSGARVQAVAWGGPLMPHSVRAWDVEMVCAASCCLTRTAVAADSSSP